MKIKNVELLKCAFHAVMKTDVQWFELYSEIVREHLDDTGRDVLDIFEEILGKVGTYDQIIYAIEDIIPSEQSLLIFNYDEILTEDTDFFLDVIRKRERKIKVKDICLATLNDKIQLDEAVKQLTELYESNDGNYSCCISALDLVKHTTEDVEWVVQDYVPCGGLVVIASEPKMGKSMLCLDLCLRLSEGEDRWLSTIPVNPCRCVYIDSENAEVLIKMRLNQLGLKPDNDKIFFITRQTLGVGRIDLTNPGTALKIKRALARLGIDKNDLVVFDSFRRLIKGDENDSKIIANAMAGIVACTPAAKIVLHHRKKNTDGGGDANAVRGSGDIVAAVDGLISIDTEGKGDNKTTDLRLSLPRWNAGVEPITIKWHETMTSLAFSTISYEQKRDLNFRGMKQIYDYLQKDFESRSLNEILAHTGIPHHELSAALATLVRQGKVLQSRVDRRTYYSIARES